MSVTNQGLVLTESISGLPIVLNGNNTPGTKIHTTTVGADDYLWLWATNTSDFNCILEIYKGNSILGFSLDNSLILAPKSNKQLIEPGILLTGELEIYGFVVLNNLSQRANVIVSGFVHRRID